MSSEIFYLQPHTPCFDCFYLSHSIKDADNNMWRKSLTLVNFTSSVTNTPGYVEVSLDEIIGKGGVAEVIIYVITYIVIKF